MADDALKILDLFLDDIRPATGAYGKTAEAKLDRYRDYRAVFMADDQGRRVLWDILAQCRTFNSPVAVVPEVGTDVPGTFAAIGRGNIGRFIMATLMEEPQAPPETTEE